MFRPLLFLMIAVSPALAAALPLEGTWSQECTAFDGGSATSTLDIYEGVWVRFTKNFADADCTEPWLETREVFYGSLSGTDNLDATWKEVSYKPLTTEIVAAFRDNLFCDLAGWKLDQWTDVTGDKCGELLLPAPGQMLYTIFRLSAPDENGEQTLFLGEAVAGFEGTTPSRRHAICEISPYRRTFSPISPSVSWARPSSLISL